MSWVLVPLQFSLSLSPGEQIPAVVPLQRPAQQVPKRGTALLPLLDALCLPDLASAEHTSRPPSGG